MSTPERLLPEQVLYEVSDMLSRKAMEHLITGNFSATYALLRPASLLRDVGSKIAARREARESQPPKKSA